MFCSNCGTQTPDDASFCHKCGKPLRQAGEVPRSAGSEPQFETCEIVYELIKKGFLWKSSDLRLWARAVGTRGVYTAGESAVWQDAADWPMSNCAEAVAEHRKLVRHLVENGWHPVGTGSVWYNDKFRRIQK
jgi:hypothetical protein